MTAKITSLALALTAGTALAFPPAPHHEIYGTVRDEQGHPLTDATVTLAGSAGDVLTGAVDPEIAPGVNYSLKVPMDAGSLADLYQSTALRPAMPFLVRVRIDGVDYLPIEVQGGALSIGDPGGRTRLDLTLGADSDGDGLPDRWEEDLIARSAELDSLADVTKEGDADGDGASNYLEYLAGTYAYDHRAVFGLEVVEVEDGLARLRFLAVRGRSYQLLSGPAGESFAPIAFRLEPDPEAGSISVFRSSSIRFQDVFVPAELVGSDLFRLQVD